MHISNWPWGSIGPRGLTHFLKQTGEIGHAMPREAFYPIAYDQAARFAQPHDLTFDSFAPETYAVHLWGKALRQYIREECGDIIPDGSFLHHAIGRYSRLIEFDISSGVKGK